MMELEVRVYRDDPRDADASTRKSFVIYGTQRNFRELGGLLSQMSPGT
jgi:hypothetical protein